jgi:hypothetical protein
MELQFVLFFFNSARSRTSSMQKNPGVKNRKCAFPQKGPNFIFMCKKGRGGSENCLYKI